MKLLTLFTCVAGLARAAGQLKIARAGVMGLFAAGLVSLPAWSQEKGKSREGVVLVTITGLVTAKDTVKRELTVIGPLGGETTVTVGKETTGFGKVEPGDTVRVDYYLVGKAEVRTPTEQEKKDPIVMLESGATPDGSEPFGGDLHVYKAVVTIEGIDRATSSITVKGPKGRYVTMPVKDPAVLKTLQLGDTIVMTYAEAFAVAIEKVTPPKKGK